MSTDLHDPLERAAASAPAVELDVTTLERRRSRKAARRRVSALALGLFITAVIAGSAFALMGDRAVDRIPAGTPDPIDGAVPTVEQIMSGEAPIGQELADQLGLVREPEFDGKCQYWADMDDEHTGYCLEGLSEDPVHMTVLVAALRGHRVTSDELTTITDTLTGDQGSVDTSVPTIEQIVSGEAPLGQELADQLGLSLQPRAQDNCRFYAPIEETTDGAESGYCIEHLSDDEMQLRVVAQALRGDRVTTEDLPDIRRAVQAGTVSPSEGGPVDIYSSTADQILGLQFQQVEMGSDYVATLDESQRDALLQQMAVLRERVQDLCASFDEVPPAVAGVCG